MGKGEIDHFSTWGIGMGDSVEIKVPYILDGERKILVGRNYMIIKNEDGSIASMNKDEFTNKYGDC